MLRIDAEATSLEPARFVSFEGVDGSGKTTQARLLAAALRERGVEVVEVREPGGTFAGERVREIVLAIDPPWPLHARAEALLFAAARAQLVSEVIEPALARGATVIADRFTDSSLVYQGVLRGLGREAVRAINEFATGGLQPDRTVVLTLDDGEARRAAPTGGPTASRSSLPERSAPGGRRLRRPGRRRAARRGGRRRAARPTRWPRACGRRSVFAELRPTRPPASASSQRWPRPAHAYLLQRPRTSSGRGRRAPLRAPRCWASSRACSRSGTPTYVEEKPEGDR